MMGIECGQANVVAVVEALQAACDLVGKMQPRTHADVASMLADVIEAKATRTGRLASLADDAAAEEEKDAVAAAAAAVARENSRWEAQLDALEQATLDARAMPLSVGGGGGGAGTGRSLKSSGSPWLDDDSTSSKAGAVLSCPTGSGKGDGRAPGRL